MSKKTIPEETQERQIFVLNETSYFADTITETGKKLINSISTIQQEIQRAKLQEEIAVIAKDAMITKLEGIAGDFEKVPAEDQTNPA